MAEDQRVVAALEEYLRLREANHSPNPSDFAARCPEIAETLRQVGHDTYGHADEGTMVGIFEP